MIDIRTQPPPPARGGRRGRRRAPLAAPRRRRARPRARRQPPAAARRTSSSSAAGFAGLTAAREIVQGRQVGDRARGARPRRRPRASTTSSATARSPSAARRSRARPRTSILALAEGRWASSTFHTYDTARTSTSPTGERSTLQRHRPDRHRAAGPADPPRPRQSSPRSNEMSTQVPVDAPWTRRARAEWDAQTLEPWIAREQPSARASARSSRSRRGRSSAPSRASSRCSSCSSTSPPRATSSNPGTFERNFNTRDGAQMFRFRGGSQRIAHELARRARLARAPAQRRCGGSTRPPAASRVHLRPARRSRRKRVIVAVPPALAGRIDYGPAADRARPAHPATTRRAP